MSLKLRAQQGFTTVTLMGVLAVGGLLVAAGFAAVDPDISMSRDDQDNKQSYGAAEAGLQWYLNSLGQDNSYYVRCTNVPDPNVSDPTDEAPVNVEWDGDGADPRIWRRLPGGQAEYAVELLPAEGFGTCVEGNQYSMVDPVGNMRIRVSGRSRGETRSVIATLRRRNFIDFIYFTHFETLDPVAYSNQSWASNNCADFRDGRDNDCIEIRFASTDEVSGPLHTNDNILVCGVPTFGRNNRDAIELNGPEPYVEDCASDPVFKGTVAHPAGQLEMPPSNQTLKDLAEDNGLLLNGSTSIVFQGDKLSVTPAGKPTVEMDPPANGVIYVANVTGGQTGCSHAYSPRQTYDQEELACGNAWVQGEYGTEMTIAADNDVIVRDDVTAEQPSLLLGLIANNFVRVYHPVTFDHDDDCVGNAAGVLNDVRIEAAILALSHSFIVDNYSCGAAMGDLNVYGAIAQRFRGPVGTGNGATISTGYRKAYEYNDRLRYREPPFFLDPVQASWRVARQTEQVPAVGVP